MIYTLCPKISDTPTASFSLPTNKVTALRPLCLTS